MRFLWNMICNMNQASVLGVLLVLCCTLDLIRCTIEDEEPCDCVWHGYCGKTEEGSPRTCVSKQCQAIPLHNKTIEALLASKCPQYFENTVGSPSLCCNADNVVMLIEILNDIDRFYGSNPACTRNVYNLLCDLVCSPKQSGFLRITRTNTDEQFGEYVEEIEAYVAEEYVNGTNNSCKNVSVAYFPALDSSCGVDGTGGCRRKLEYEHQVNPSTNRSADLGVTLVTQDKSWKNYWNKPICNECYDGSPDCCWDFPHDPMFPPSHDHADSVIHTTNTFFTIFFIVLGIILLCSLFTCVYGLYRCHNAKVRSPGFVYYSGTTLNAM